VLITAGDRTVPCTVQTRSWVSPADAYRVIVPLDLSLVFKAWGPFPGVNGASNQTGAWDAAGQTRNPELTDGSTAFELLTEVTPGHSFAYETTGFTNILGKLIEGIRGEWTFTPDGSATLIRWTYEFKPLPGRYQVLKWIVVPLWRHYMQNGLNNSARAAEERTPVA
jgi:Polyketide cyclase / dehydrase and lipid transport